jgi:hypothetical protein
MRPDEEPLARPVVEAESLAETVALAEVHAGVRKVNVASGPCVKLTSEATRGQQVSPEEEVESLALHLPEKRGLDPVLAQHSGQVEVAEPWSLLTNENVPVLYVVRRTPLRCTSTTSRCSAAMKSAPTVRLRTRMTSCRASLFDGSLERLNRLPS